MIFIWLNIFYRLFYYEVKKIITAFNAVKKLINYHFSLEVLSEPYMMTYTHALTHLFRKMSNMIIIC